MLWAGQRRRLPLAVRRPLTLWRRSIQARVVASTLVLSALVVGGVGWFLLQQTRDGLLDHRVKAVVAEANTEVADSQTGLNAAPPGQPSDALNQLSNLVDPIINRGSSRGFFVVLAGPGALGGTQSSPHLMLASVPDALQHRFRSSAGSAWTYTQIVTQVDDGTLHREPGIVVGSQVVLPADGKTYTLYLLFPLDDEQETLGLVTRAMLTAGGLLLVLIAALTWLVTRQVVTPIRLARQVAERLAAGRLQERMRVDGEDDLARLATSFNQMATNLQRHIRQLEELSRVQRRFVSDVSHELRTPLTTVRMASEVLHDARSTFDPVTARSAELLQTELDRFESMLVDLLEISRYDAGAAVLEIDDVDLLGVARRVVEATRPLAQQRGVRVRVRGPGHACLAEADIRRVERVVRNLVTNAIDHAGDRARVVVHVEGDEHAAAVTVRDYGVGLQPGDSERVFDRFWRGDPARARTSGGTGLGLSIALEDARLHDGWLQAWGRPGEGAQFRLTLPRRRGEPLRHSPLRLVPADVVLPDGSRPDDVPPGREPSALPDHVESLS